MYTRKLINFLVYVTACDLEKSFTFDNKVRVVFLDFIVIRVETYI